MRIKRIQHEVTKCAVASVCMAFLATICYRLRLNLATASLLNVVVIALVSRTGSFASSIVAALFGALCLAYVASPGDSVRVDNPFDVVAVAVFLIISLVIAQLVSRLRRMAEEAVRSVDGRLVQAQERERAWVARELHDDVSQRMALALADLERLQGVLAPLDLAATQSLKAVTGQISEVAADIQALAQHLHSHKLQLLGIVVVAKSFCKELADEHALPIEIRCEKVPQNLPEDVGVCLYRVLQEALHNAVKHSKSERFAVRLSGIADGIELSVRDDGVGFNPELAVKKKGLGLVSMRERIRMMNGEFSIDSQTNSGTTIYVKVPFRGAQPATAN